MTLPGSTRNFSCRSRSRRGPPTVTNPPGGWRCPRTGCQERTCTATGGLGLLFVGGDWVEDHHDIVLMDQAGRMLARARLPEGVAGIADARARNNYAGTHPRPQRQRCTAPARRPARRHPARLPKTGTVHDESTAWAPPPRVNRMPLDKQAHDMSQGPYRHGQFARSDV